MRCAVRHDKRNRLPGADLEVRDGGHVLAVRLDRRSRMLYDSTHVYLNGSIFASLAGHPILAVLADRRRLPPGTGFPKPTIDLMFDAYLTGALHAGAT